MHLIDVTTDDAIALVEAILRHVPADEPAAAPHIVHGGSRVVLTEADERYALEIDEETGDELVSRVRSAGPGLSELTVWQDGHELARHTEPWGT